MEYANPEIRQFGLVMAASYLRPIDGQVHPLQLIMKDRPVLHRAIANGGIFIDGSAALDASTLFQLHAVASGSAFDKGPTTIEAEGDTEERGVFNPPYISGETASEEFNRLEQSQADDTTEVRNGTPHVPLIFNKCLDGGFADVLGEADQTVTNWNHVEVGFTISPSARHIGIVALQQRFGNNPNVRLYMSGPMPEDDPSRSRRFTGKSERKYTKHLAELVHDYGFAALASYGANAEDTLPFQELIAMGIVTDNDGSYESTYENNGVEVKVQKRSTTVERALRGATFNEEGVCNTKLLIGHELDKAKGHVDMTQRRRKYGNQSFDWGSSEGIELAGNYAQVLTLVLDRAMEADLSPARSRTKFSRRMAHIPVLAPMKSDS